MSEPYILVLYYSAHGTTAALAKHIARGIEKTGISARLRTVPRISAVTERSEATIPESGALYCDKDDLRHCLGLVVGSPTRFGNMAAPLKYFIDECADLWLAGDLVDKPFGVFTSTSTLHGGQESTLLTMALPFIHQGMIYCGIPFTEPSLHNLQSGGSPYGASHLKTKMGLSDGEKQSATALGQRIATLAVKLA